MLTTLSNIKAEAAPIGTTTAASEAPDLAVSSVPGTALSLMGLWGIESAKSREEACITMDALDFSPSGRLLSPFSCSPSLQAAAEVSAGWYAHAGLGLKQSRACSDA